MAYDTFTLNIRDTTPDGVKPTFWKVRAYPLATSDGRRLRKILDSSGHTIITGHAEKQADAGQMTAGLLPITLPDPRDATHLAPNGFGWEIEVSTNYFNHTETFGPDDITAAISDGVVELEAVAAADTSAFEATTNYATASDLTSEAASRVSGDAAAASDATTKANAAQAFAIQRANHTGTQTSSTISDFTEAAQDAIAAALAGATGATVTYNDAANTITITGVGDPETMRDTIGAALVGIGNISVAINDGADTITISTTATANDTDANLKARANHTGVQAISTVTGLQTALDAKLPNVPTYTLAARPTATGSGLVIFVSDVAGGQLQQDTAAATWTPLAPGVSQGNLGLVAQTVQTADSPTTTSTTDVDAGVSLTFTAVAAATYAIRLKTLYMNQTSGKKVQISICKSDNTILDLVAPLVSAAFGGSGANLEAYVTPGAGSVTYKVRISTGSAGTAGLVGGATYPITLSAYRVA